MKNKNVVLISVSIILAILVVVFGAVMGILKANGVIETNLTVFEIMFMIFTYGFGAIIFVYGLVSKGGYEKAIGLILLDVAIVTTLIFTKVYWVVTLIIAISVVLITVLLVILFSAKKLYVERTNEKEGFKSYSEVLQEKKEEEKLNEEPMPEVKSFKK